MSDMPTGSGVKRGNINRSGTRFGEAECMPGTSVQGGGHNDCDCDQWQPSTQIAVRNALVKLGVMRTAYSVNGTCSLAEADEYDLGAVVEGEKSFVPFNADPIVYEI
ncbi:uncharacterized protein PHALS_11820 [Plasmopara halstedii]|uniref:Uncharacterized protein n=1 Tax=Plasmopara halstedii TaxID=4781 RepID=A0A0P1AJF0_PLAHL|nr:uncharacterized protein PHALS_11820 [Plasmopara halstedii]CEG41478.1 hypothetical protein PHALS_11820 [Plasmopara halstedii]|eukprot:XP_024577847.1 hypothetical protein PHALS_11820 [Plasmopara halstedii]